MDDRIREAADDLLLALEQYADGDCSFSYVLDYADDLRKALDGKMGNAA